MKTIVKSAITIALVALCNNVSAQTPKWAHINLDELIVAMPEFDSAQVKLQKFGQELDEAMDEMRVEFNRKWEEFQKLQESWTELVRQSKTDDLQNIQTRIQTFQQNAQESFQQEQERLMQPVFEKANKAVDTVAKEQGITYVITANPQVLIFKAADTLDLLPAVKQHLGIKN